MSWPESGGNVRDMDSMVDGIVVAVDGAGRVTSAKGRADMRGLA